MSELSLGQIKGLTVNSNVVTVPSGHTLYAPGHVIQVVQSSTVTPVTNTSSTYADTTLSATITPKSTTSKILVTVSHQYQTATSPIGNDTWFSIRIVRGSTVIIEPATTYETGRGAGELRGRFNTTYLDSPNTTSPINYKTQSAIYNASRVTLQDSGNYSTITLMEIAA